MRWIGLIVVVAVFSAAARESVEQVQPTAEPPVMTQPVSEQPAQPPPVGGARPDEMDALWPLVGEWVISGWFAGAEDAKIELAGAATITSTLGGCFLEERGWYESPGQRTEFLAMRGYDRGRGEYRVVYFDDTLALADVYEGAAFEEGELVTTNLRCATFTFTGGAPQALRGTTRIDDDGFTIRWDGSGDGGESWFAIGEMIYRAK